MTIPPPSPRPTLYHIPRTISSPIVQILIELGVVATGTVADDDCASTASDAVNVCEITFDTLQQADYLQHVNPMGTCPAYHDTSNHLHLWESGAILDYLLEVYDTAGRFHPIQTNHTSAGTKQHLRRAEFRNQQQFLLATFYPFVSALYLHSRKPKAQQDAAFLHSAITKCRQVYCPVMAGWLADDNYLQGNTISAVDFIAAKPLGNLYEMGVLTAFPRLVALYQRVRERPSYGLAYQAGGLVAPRCEPEHKTVSRCTRLSTTTRPRACVSPSTSAAAAATTSTATTLPCSNNVAVESRWKRAKLAIASTTM